MKMQQRSLRSRLVPKKGERWKRWRFRTWLEVFPQRITVSVASHLGHNKFWQSYGKTLIFYASCYQCLDCLLGQSRLFAMAPRSSNSPALPLKPITAVAAAVPVVECPGCLSRHSPYLVLYYCHVDKSVFPLFCTHLILGLGIGIIFLVNGKKGNWPVIFLPVNRKIWPYLWTS